MKKTLSLLLVIFLLLSSVLVACTPSNQAEEGTSPEQTTIENTTPEKTTPETTTPEVTTPEETTPTEPIVPTKVLQTVTISAGDSSVEQLALAELQKHLEIKGVSVADGGFPISLLIDESLGDDSYRIEGAANVTEEQTGDEYVHIIGGNGRAVYYGVVRFLEDFAGTRFFTYELERMIPNPLEYGKECRKLNFYHMLRYQFSGVPEQAYSS